MEDAPNANKNGLQWEIITYVPTTALKIKNLCFAKLEKNEIHRNASRSK